MSDRDDQKGADAPGGASEDTFEDALEQEMDRLFSGGSSDEPLHLSWLTDSPEESAEAEAQALKDLEHFTPPSDGAWRASLNAAISHAKRALNEGAPEPDPRAFHDVDAALAQEKRSERVRAFLAPIAGAHDALQIALTGLQENPTFALTRWRSQVRRRTEEDLLQMAFRYGGTTAYERLQVDDTLPAVETQQDLYRACATLAERFELRARQLASVIQATNQPHKALAEAQNLRAWAWGALITHAMLADTPNPQDLDTRTQQLLTVIRTHQTHRNPNTANN